MTVNIQGLAMEAVAVMQRHSVIYMHNGSAINKLGNREKPVPWGKV